MKLNFLPTNWLIIFLFSLLTFSSAYAQTTHSSSLTANNNDGELIWTPDLSTVNPPESVKNNAESNCDVIKLRNGKEILAHVTSVEPWVVKYRKCGKTKGNPLVLSKTHIKSINFGDGDILDVEQELKDKEAAAKKKEPRQIPNYDSSNLDAPSNGNNYYYRPNYEQTTKTDALAVLSLLSSIAAFFVAGIILGILAIVLGAVSLGRIARHRNLKGMVAAYIGVVLGFIALMLTIVFLLVIL